MSYRRSKFFPCQMFQTSKEATGRGRKIPPVINYASFLNGIKIHRELQGLNVEIIYGRYRPSALNRFSCFSPFSPSLPHTERQSVLLVLPPFLQEWFCRINMAKPQPDWQGADADTMLTRTQVARCQCGKQRCRIRTSKSYRSPYSQVWSKNATAEAWQKHGSYVSQYEVI